MALKTHGFCPRHRIAFNYDLDPVCPQCTMAGIPPEKALDFDTDRQTPVDAQGRALDRRTLEPVK